MLFPNEIEEEKKLLFFDVLLIRNGNFIEIKVYPKPTNNHIYLNWNSISLNTLKGSTLWTWIKRAYLICSSEKHLLDELKQLEYTFEKYNNFFKWVIEQLLSEVKLEDSHIRSSIQDNQNDINKTVHLLFLTYARSKGEKLIKSMNKLQWKIVSNMCYLKMLQLEKHIRELD